MYTKKGYNLRFLEERKILYRGNTIVIAKIYLKLRLQQNMTHYCQQNHLLVLLQTISMLFKNKNTQNRIYIHMRIPKKILCCSQEEIK